MREDVGMRIGIVILPQRPWHEQRELWRRAEDYGFDHAFTYDHLSWRSLAGQSWGATVPTLAGAALVTERIRLGTFVASPNFRHPVPFAKDLATIDEMSGGRFTLGLGAGTTGFDADVLGTAPLTAGDRHARFMEFVDVLDLLLRFEQPGTDGIDFDGQWYTAARARMVGRPAQSPRMPFVIAANGPRGIARAVQTGQGWVTTGPATDDEREWRGRTRPARRRCRGRGIPHPSAGPLSATGQRRGILAGQRGAVRRRRRPRRGPRFHRRDRALAARRRHLCRR
jgi:alkanesulfonate monooxygenase SsuD/methylene tetrahydromethanopterin reductase-like flavin-dependent oxidoreductase (luciferase family)